MGVLVATLVLRLVLKQFQQLPETAEVDRILHQQPSVALALAVTALLEERRQGAQ